MMTNMKAQSPARTPEPCHPERSHSPEPCHPERSHPERFDPEAGSVGEALSAAIKPDSHCPQHRSDVCRATALSTPSS